MDAPAIVDGAVQIDRQHFEHWLANQTEPREPGATKAGVCFFGAYLKENGIKHDLVCFDRIEVGRNEIPLPKWAETATRKWCSAFPAAGARLGPDLALAILRRVE